MPKLTDQQKLFAREYVRSGFDSLQAVTVAVYSKRNADSIAFKLLQKTRVKAEIDHVFEQTEETQIWSMSEEERQLYEEYAYELNDLRARDVGSKSIDSETNREV